MAFRMRDSFLGKSIPPLRLSTRRDDNTIYLIPKGLAYKNNIDSGNSHYRLGGADVTLNLAYGVIKVQRVDPASIRKNDPAMIFKKITEENKAELNLLTDLAKWQIAAWFPFDLKDINLDDYYLHGGGVCELVSYMGERLPEGDNDWTKVFASYIRENPLYKDVFGMGKVVPPIRTLHKEYVSVSNPDIMHLIEEGLSPDLFRTTLGEFDKDLSGSIKLEEGEKAFIMSKYHKIDTAILVLSNRFSKEVKTIKASEASLRVVSVNKAFNDTPYYVSKDWDLVGCIHDAWSLHFEIYTYDPDVLTGMFDCKECEVTVRVIDNIEGYREVIRNPGKTVVVMPEGLTLANFVPESKDFEDDILELFEQDFDEGTEPCI